MSEQIYLVMAHDAADFTSWVLNIWRSKEDAEQTAKNFTELRRPNEWYLSYTVETRELL